MKEDSTTDEAISTPDASAAEVDYCKDPAIMFVKHEACWDLEFRGAVGETTLHLCYLNNTPIHLEIARILLDLYPKLSLDIYEAEEYYGKYWIMLTYSQARSCLVFTLY